MARGRGVCEGLFVLSVFVPCRRPLGRALFKERGATAAPRLARHLNFMHVFEIQQVLPRVLARERERGGESDAKDQ